MATPALEYDAHLTLDSDSQEYKDMEKRIVRKQDWRIMPLICLSYLLSSSIFPSSTFPFLTKLLLHIDYLDRSNLGNARTLNNDKPGESLVESLALKGLRYNIIVAIFFVPCKLTSHPTSTSPTYPLSLLPAPSLLYLHITS